MKKLVYSILCLWIIGLSIGCSGDKAQMLQQLEQLEQRNRSGEAMLNDSLAESLVNYMLNAMIYCLVLRIQFQIYSADANFGTGVGWMEYFQPFCQEVHEKYHATYNLYGIEEIIIMFTAYWPGWCGGHNRHCNSRWLMPAG